MAEAFPLHWPLGWERTAKRKRAPYHFGRKQRAYQQGAADEASVLELKKQLRMLGATGVVISTNIELRRDGLPYANRRIPDDPGVAVYFQLDGQARCIPCDKWDRVADNMYAIARTIDALRQLDRDGTKGIVQAAFAGFKALPAAGGTSGLNWWDVLGVSASANMTEIDASYRALARRLHPDIPGAERGSWDDLQEAYRQAKQARGAA